MDLVYRRAIQLYRCRVSWLVSRCTT